MKGVLLKDGDTVRILDYIDTDTVNYEFMTCGVDLGSYQRFLSDQCNYIYSADGRVELRRVDEQWLKIKIGRQIERAKRELDWLYMEESELDAKSD